jgi:hypothetical protein
MAASRETEGTRWRTALYLVSSALVGALGLALLFASPQSPNGQSIATSLIAGAVAAIAYGVGHYLTELDDHKTKSDLDQTLVKFMDQLSGLSEQLSGLKQEIATVSRLAGSLLEKGSSRISGRHPKQEVQRELERLGKNDEVLIEAIGLSLGQFASDYLDKLGPRKKSEIRLLVQHPLARTFTELCAQEGRDVAAMAREVLQTTERVLEIERTQSASESGRPKVSIKWFKGFPTISFTRINSVWFLRFRALKEASGSPIFFERYIEEEDVCSDAITSYFGIAWLASETPDKELCQEVRRQLNLVGD